VPASRTNDPVRTMTGILEVATQEFASKGLSGGRIDAIAEATRTSKRMIYYYFGSKEGLYLAVLEESYRKMRQIESELQLDNLAPEQALRFAQRLDVIPGAFELLGALQIPFCVATNGPREKVELTLGLTGLRRFFPEHIFSAYEVGIFKPDPGLFLHAAQVLGMAPEHCAVVEDSLPGIQAGLNAGMRVFSLLPAADLPPDMAERVVCIRDLTDLDSVLHTGSHRD